MRTVVISQPMFFPWVGHLEQLRLADDYLHYDDVQFSRGSFTNRVQLKGPQGPQWLTVPLRDVALGQAIRDVALDERKDWRRKHLATLAQLYDRAPFRQEMLALVEEVYARPLARLGELAIASTEVLSAYFGLGGPFRHAAELAVPGKGSERVLAIVQALGGTRYVTGHGARHYLDHAAFEAAGIEVAYMAYQRTPYPQRHGPFDPHVSALDLVANQGRAGATVIASPAIPWRRFLALEPGA